MQRDESWVENPREKPLFCGLLICVILGNGLTTDGHVNQNMVLRANGKSIFSKIPDVTSLIELLRVPQDQGANLYYLPAARSTAHANPPGDYKFSCRACYPYWFGASLPEGSTFSGMIADFLQQIIHYKARPVVANGYTDQVSSIAKVLEDEILHGADRGQPSCRRGISGILVPPSADRLGTGFANEPSFGNGS